MQPRVDDSLLGEAVLLDLEVEAVLEELRVLPRQGAGLVHVAGKAGLGDLALNAGREAHEAFGVLAEDLPVHARLVEKALEPALGDDLDEVAVAVHVLGQQDEMVAALGVLACRVEVVAAGVDLAAEDGLDAVGGAGLLEGGGREHVAVVRHGRCRHAVVLGPLAEILQADRAVEHAVFGVAVEMDEVGHGAFLHAGARRKTCAPPSC